MKAVKTNALRFLICSKNIIMWSVWVSKNYRLVMNKRAFFVFGRLKLMVIFKKYYFFKLKIINECSIFEEMKIRLCKLLKYA